MSVADILPKSEEATRPAPQEKIWDASGPTSEYFPVTTRSGVLLVLALSSIFFITCLNRLHHTDLWGHLAFGRWIAAHDALPTSDPFGAFPSTAPFSNMPWLAQLTEYATWESLGADGLVLLHGLLATVGCGFLAAAIYRRGVPLNWAMIGSVAAYVVALPTIGVIRPQLFGVVGVPAILWAVTELGVAWHPVFWLPAVFALWANLHGSFAVGLVVLGLGSLAAGLEAYRNAGNLAAVLQDGKTQRLFLATFAAACGALLNPLGIGLFFLTASFGSHEALDNITEWQMMDPVSLTGGLFIATLAITVLAAYKSRRGWEGIEALLLIAFAGFAVSAMRMLPWWAMIWPWAIAPHVADAWSALQNGGTDEATDEAPAEAGTTMNTILAMGIVFATLLLAPPTNSLVLGRERGLGVVASTETPLALADELNRRNIREAIFAPIDLADYLVWQTNGNVKPLAYTHVHLLDKELWRDQQAISSGQDDWMRVADRRGIRYLVFDRERSKHLIGKLFSHPRARVVYQDQQTMLVRVVPKVDPKPAAKKEEKSTESKVLLGPVPPTAG